MAIDWSLGLGLCLAIIWLSLSVELVLWRYLGLFLFVSSNLVMLCCYRLWRIFVWALFCGVSLLVFPWSTTILNSVGESPSVFWGLSFFSLRGGLVCYFFG
jgi:hypothetical protein